MREIRLAVGSPTGIRSTVWRLWTRKEEFYIQSRMLGASSKVSIHSGGKAQWSMDSTWYGVNRPGQPNRLRHIDEWRWAEPVGTVAQPVFKIFVPASELRVIKEPEDLTKVFWLQSLPDGKQTLLDCFVAPAAAIDISSETPGLICALERSERTSVVVLGHIVGVSDYDLRERARVFEEVRMQASADEITIQKGFRLVALSRDPEGHRGMVEFVPSPVIVE